MTSVTTRSVRSLQEHLQARAGNYFPELPPGEWSIALKASSRRRYSQILRFALQCNGVNRQLFVKMPRTAPALRRRQSSISGDRPRLMPLLSAREEAAYEFAGMRRLSAHFQRHGDQLLGVAPVLDLYDDQAIVMETIPFPTLDRVFARTARWRKPANVNDIAASFRAAGAWLRALHEMPPDEANQPRLSTSDELLQLVHELIDYLAEGARLRSFLGALRPTIEQFVQTKLPQKLPLVVGHGDFGLHNLFVTPERGILGFDTLAHWQIPPQIDVAYFLLLLETVPPLFVSRKWTTRAEIVWNCRQEFLRGYSGESSGEPAHLVFFELLVALDKWASVVHSARTGLGVRGALKRGRLLFQEHWLAERFRSLLARLECDQGAPCEVPLHLTARSPA